MDFDLVVIGCGPAGEKGAAQAAWAGKRVAVVEKSRNLGGACANTGTLASKTLRESALLLSGYRQRQVPGIELSVKRDPSVADFMAHKEAVCAAERARIAANLDRHHITLLTGEARFVDPHTIRVGERTVTASVFLLATGTVPHRPPGIAFRSQRIDDSDEILGLDRMPRSLVVAGAGVIGSEYASIFATLGCTVTLVDGRDRLLPFLDPEISDRLAAHLRDRLGVDLRLGDSVLSTEEREDTLAITLASGEHLVAERLLYCAGRRAATGSLGLDAIGVALDARGYVQVDADYRTNLPHVYAAGDVIGFPALASVSMEQARLAMCHAFGLTYKTRVPAELPLGIYTIPEVSAVGLTEAEARAQGMDVEVGRARYADNARGQIEGDRDGFLKLVFRAEDRVVVGVHVIGERATELIHLGELVIRTGGTIHAFIDLVFNYPTLGELYKYAAYDGLGALARRGIRTG
jgi:NAD(P) transhydrogenase